MLIQPSVCTPASLAPGHFSPQVDLAAFSRANNNTAFNNTAFGRRYAWLAYHCAVGINDVSGFSLFKVNFDVESVCSLGKTPAIRHRV